LSLTWNGLSVSERAGFDRIIGNELARKILSRAAKSQRPAHSYLFLGAEGVGKLTTALQFAKALNCEQPTESGACEVCASCRRIEHLTTTDLIIYAPEKNKTVISIEQMQQMREFCQLRPATMRWKVMILEKADVLGEEAANCILKLLEDAPDYLVVIQAVTNPANVLATIRSRSQVVRFHPSDIDKLAERLAVDHSVEAGKAQFLSRFSLGCPGKAITYGRDDSFLVERDEVIEFGRQVLTANKWSLLVTARLLRMSGQSKSEPADDDESSEANGSDADLDEAEKDAQASADARRDAGRSQRGAATARLALAISWFRDLAAIKIGGDDAVLINLDRRDRVIEQAAMVPDTGLLLGALDALVRARSAIVSNANAQIVTESLVMQLASLVRRN